MLRRCLMYLRKQYNTNLKNFCIWVGSGLVLAIIIGVMVDVFLPFHSIWMILRSLLLIPITTGVFSLSYLLSLRMHNNKVQTDDEWVPFRLRYPVSWRRRIAIIIGAFLLVLMYANANSFTPMYTLLSSCFVAIIIALFAFIRPTREEQIREELEIPDSRDLQYAEYVSNSTKNKKKD